MRDTLFRQQVIEEKSEAAFGKVLLSPPISVKISIALLVSVFITATAFLFCGHYSRREKAVGILVPDRGLIKIYAPRPGIIGDVRVKEGDKVTENSELFTLSQDKILATDREATKAQLSELDALAKNLELRLQMLPERKMKEANAIQSELGNTKQSIGVLLQQKKLDNSRLELKENRQKRISPLYQQKTVSADEYQQDVDQLLQMKNQLQQGHQAVLSAEAKETSLTAKLDVLEASYSDQEGNLLTQLAQVRLQMNNLGLQQNQSIASPIKGAITSIQVYPGMSVNIQKPLAAILPENSHLEAHIFVPTRAIAFIKPGQKVLLQYEAFPHQKYGVQIGHVLNVSLTVLNPAEISELDITATHEPYYRITVALDNNSIRAFEQTIPLQNGMMLSADIILESRSLLEWILEPLYRVRG